MWFIPIHNFDQGLLESNTLICINKRKWLSYIANSTALYQHRTKSVQNIRYATALNFVNFPKPVPNSNLRLKMPILF